MTFAEIAAESWQRTRHALRVAPTHRGQTPGEMHPCMDCGTSVAKRAQRCVPCYAKSKRTPPGAVRDVQRIEYSVFPGQKEMHRR